MGTLKTAMVATVLFLACSSSKTFDKENNNPNEGSDVFSVNAPAHDNESKVDSSSPPPDSAYNPPSAETTETSDATSDSSDSVDAGDSNVDVNALDDSDGDTTDSADTTDIDSADGDSGAIIPPSPDTFVGIDTPVVNTETSPDTTDTVDNIETADSDDSDDSSDTPASTDSADGEEMEIATVSCVCLDDNNQCTKDFCNEMDECVHQLIKGCCKEDAECDDGDKCNSFEKCCHEFGFCFICTFIEPPLCDDDNPCTDNSCDPSTGGCVFTPNNSSCDDNNPCTINDACQNKECVGEPVQCECQSTADCAKLEDGNPCNGTLKCQNMVCVVDTETVINCLDDDLCTDDSCNQDTGKCTHTNTVCESDSPYVGAWCNPSVGCVYDQLDCVWDTECGDDDACTDDTCVYGQCVNTNTCECTQDSQCDDGSKCTIDSCVGGKCQNEKVVCVDPDVCTKGVCIETGCIYVPITDCCVNDVECDDGDVCNGAETCDMNKCVAGQKLVCSDFNVCTDDFCDSVEGCVYEQNTNPCDDGDICTTNSCDATTGCIYKPISGCCKTDIDCNDINQCTGDACIKSSGECVHFGLLGNCDDGNACTANDTCQIGKCVGGAAPDCDDKNICTADSCDPTIGCQHSAVSNGTSCLDDTVCNGAETCQSGLCKSGVALDCGDSNQCTNDSCNAATGCVHTDKPDTDSDGLCDLADNCPAIANADQADMDKDGVGDACDPDKDGDSISNSADNCPNVPNLGQADMDKDGVGDVCDSVNTCKLSADGLPANFYIPVPLCINGCFVGSQIVCTKCISTHTNCTSDNDGDGPSMCYGDCNDNTGGVKYSCWPAEQPPPACSGSVWTPQ